MYPNCCTSKDIADLAFWSERTLAPPKKDVAIGKRAACSKGRSATATVHKNRRHIHCSCHQLVALIIRVTSSCKVYQIVVLTNPLRKTCYSSRGGQPSTNDLRYRLVKTFPVIFQFVELTMVSTSDGRWCSNTSFGKLATYRNPRSVYSIPWEACHELEKAQLAMNSLVLTSQLGSRP